jgi:hypothetical protein
MTPSERVVARVIRDERDNPRWQWSAQTGKRHRLAIMPFVLARTGVSAQTFNRVCRAIQEENQS